MSKARHILAEFVQFIPEHLEEGKLYVSKEYGTAAHLCCCGCRNKVVTPLGPTSWKLTGNSNAVTLYPSIGNWSFACQSHYWIRGNCVLWAEQWSKERIDAGRNQDRLVKDLYFKKEDQETEHFPADAGLDVPRESMWTRIMRWLLKN